jgi:hypothetical protein
VVTTTQSPHYIFRHYVNQIVESNLAKTLNRLCLAYFKYIAITCYISRAMTLLVWFCVVIYLNRNLVKVLHVSLLLFVLNSTHNDP